MYKCDCAFVYHYSLELAVMVVGPSRVSKQTAHISPQLHISVALQFHFLLGANHPVPVALYDSFLLWVIALFLTVFLM